MVKIHLDTDIGGDSDDVCAIALLLRLPEVELTGVTTCTEAGGQRAGLTRHTLDVAGRSGIPVAAGAEGSIGGYDYPPGITDVQRHWLTQVEPAPSRPGEALDLLLASVEAGAAIVAIGPYTNLALLEAARPGTLAHTEVYLMGGFVDALPPGMPPLDYKMDYNVQQDAAAARIVLAACDPVVVQVSVTLKTTLREAHLPRLRAGDRLAQLVAHQGEDHGRENNQQAMGRAHAALPDGLLNFQHDPLTCALPIAC